MYNNSNQQDRIQKARPLHKSITTNGYLKGYRNIRICGFRSVILVFENKHTDTLVHEHKAVFGLEMLLACVFITGAWILKAGAEFSTIQTNDVWQLYFARGQQDCSEDGKHGRFPEIYQTILDAEVGPPMNFSMTYFERPASGNSPYYFFPGVNVEFYPPQIGQENVRGYELNVTWKSDVACFVYVLNPHGGEARQEKIATEFFPLHGMMSYWFVVTSLPVYSVNQSSTRTQLVTNRGYYRDPDDKLSQPANWFAHISYDVIKSNGSRSLQIIFSRPPQQYGFHRFEIALIPVEDYIHVRVTITTEFYHEFLDVAPGHYKISITAVDDFFSQYGRCLCHNDWSCTNCLSSTTAVFVID